ncbi:MAG: aldehyde dehydrogenase family protein [Syntrophobacteraceae bacterium]
MLDRYCDTPSKSWQAGVEMGSSGGQYRSLQELKDTLSVAREASRAWSCLSARERASCLAPAGDFLISHADALARTIADATGKTRIEALATEVIPARIALSYYLRHAMRFLRSRFVPPSSFLLANKWSRIVRAPYGVVGIISPWNYPFAIPFSEIIMALLAGNAVVFKAASQSRTVASEIGRCLRHCGIPPELFTLLPMPGSLAGPALLGAGIDKLFFTGSVAIGKQLMAKAAETLTPLSLELGGNDPMLVCEDANIERAVSGAVWAGLQNCGQSCGGVERIYVHESVYEAFLDGLKHRVGGLRVGPDTNHSTDMGALTTDRQMATVRMHLEDALAKGAEVAVRSCMPAGLRGNFMDAVVLKGVDHRMLVMREETFGPLLGVMRVSDMDEGVRLANDSVHGLTASVWSRNARKAEAIGRRIQAGVITINDHLVSHGMPETPWGGFKASGIGRTHGEIGFQEMTQPQVIVHDVLGWAKRDLWWQPYSEAVYRGLKGAMQVFYGTSVRQRLSGMKSLLKILPRLFR